MWTQGDKLTGHIFPTTCWISLQWWVWKWGFEIKKVDCDCSKCWQRDTVM